MKIYLPRLTDAISEPAYTPEGEAQPIHGGSETILLVEDHDDLRQYGANVLEEFGYRVLQAGTGREALAILETSPSVDLLLTDVVLPDGLDGRRLADEATRRRASLKVLFTTGYTRNAIVHNGRLDAGVNLIGKPFTASNLAKKVREVLDL